MASIGLEIFPPISMRFSFLKKVKIKFWFLAYLLHLIFPNYLKYEI